MQSADSPACAAPVVEVDKKERREEEDGRKQAEKTKTVLGLTQIEAVILSAHTIVRFFLQSSDFAVPVLLATLDPSSLLAPALFGLCTRAAKFLLSPSLGAWMDRRTRKQGLRVGLLMQVVGSVTACLSFLTLALFLPDTSETGAGQEGEGGVGGSGMLFSTPTTAMASVFLLIGGSIDALGNVVITVAIECDWVTLLVPKPRLPTVNAWFQRMDLAMEIAGPAAVGAAIAVATTRTAIAGVIVAVYVCTVVSLVFQYAVMSRLLVKFPSLMKRKVDEKEKSKNPLHGFVKGWTILLHHKGGVWIVVGAMVMIWITVLSPHNVLLTAYLTEQGMEAWSLAIFRGVGAGFGVASTIMAPLLIKKMQPDRSSLLFLWSESCILLLSIPCFLIATSPFMLEKMGIDETINATTAFAFPPQAPLATAMALIFLLFLILARFGVYGFSVSQRVILQELTSEATRLQVFGAEKSLTSLASLLVFLAGVILNDTTLFTPLIYVSTGAVFVGAILISVWRLRYGAYYASLTAGAHDEDKELKGVEEEDEAEKDGEREGDGEAGKEASV
uniref:Solute carrier family 40 member n=1 Tax=Palpitomonas bilix TaxID=652834 RepID=A0A7S3GKS0_9EUKA|mmetsp:Transcript_7868/g.20472  ORF Transcript_7868/g.20472 Transcript_7868/m.20472 type:complete len:560 (+) Transcript_7868:81-1760(+)